MADPILQAVAIRRDLIEGVGVQDELQQLIAKFATTGLYRRPGQTIERMRRGIVRLVSKRFFPLAEEVGRAAPRPILEALSGAPILERASAVRGPLLKSFRRYRKANLQAFHAALRRETGALSGEIEASFFRAYRDGEARGKLVGDLVKADRDELESIADARRKLARANRHRRKIEGEAAKAGRRQQPRLKRELRKARKEVRLAKQSVRARKSFLARFETKVQGEVRDSIRREAEEAQFAEFRQRGYTKFSWVAVNGSDACPSCEARHGWTHTVAEWRKLQKPGASGTYCEAACMCMLVPAEIEQPEKPLRA